MLTCAIDGNGKTCIDPNLWDHHRVCDEKSGIAFKLFDTCSFLCLYPGVILSMLLSFLVENQKAAKLNRKWRKFYEF